MSTPGHPAFRVQSPAKKVGSSADSPIDKAKLLQIEFLKTELEAALAFTGRAMATRDVEARERNLRNARQVYETLCQRLRQLSVDPADAEQILSRFEVLRTHLKELGEKL